LGRVALDGRVTVPDTRPPGGRWPAGAVEDGLLLGTRDGGLLVWNPATRNIVRRLPAADYGPAAGNTVVSCHDPCGGLTITDVGTGETRTLPASRDHLFEPWSGHFSPDGDVLAMPVRASRDMQDRHLALVNIRSGRATIVEGSRVPPTFTFVAWSHSGEHVFLTGGERFGTRVLVAYRLGDPRAEVIDVEVGDFYDVAAM
jgi:hypothetical protein